MRILIVYASETKQTEKIAFFIGDQLSLEGSQVGIYDVKNMSDINLNNFDALLVGAPVRMQKYPEKLEAWVRDHLPYFYHKPTAFFSVCLGILDLRPETQRRENEIVQEFLHRTHWQTDLKQIFAGCLRYSQYNFFLKLMMWGISLSSGQKTNIFRDEEYTDWAQVKEFAKKFTVAVKVEEECNRMATLSQFDT